MQKKTLLVALAGLIFFNFQSFGQEATPQTNAICGTESPGQQWESEMQKLVNVLNQSQSAAKQQQAPVYTIPVIVHVIHGGQSVGTYPNLAQGQIASQIQALNYDYGGIGYNTWTYPTTAYSNWATAQNLPAANLDALGRVKIANCNVQFCLATKDTLGNPLPEPGIDRINYFSKGWTNPASFSSNNNLKNYVDGTIKPASIWNVSKYLNIWITDRNSNLTLLGYATFPPLTNLSGLSAPFGSATTDGFWCYSFSFGSITYYPQGNYLQGYERGRTSTHEIGHWLGLRHIWGDGTCATDYCNDTPPAQTNNFNSPTYPYNAGSCTGNSPNGEMFMNFMDYTDDPVKYMYTTDQATRIQAAMSNSPYRKFLGTHNLCSVLQVAATPSFNVPTGVCGSAVITLTNMTVGTPVPTYTWSSSGPAPASFFPNNNAALTVSFSTAGTYTITLAAGNGTTNSISKQVVVNPAPALVISTPITTVCLNDDLVLTASGGNAYSWQPGSLLGSSVTYPAMTAAQVFTCSATGNGNCKTISTISIDVTDCTGLSRVSGLGGDDFRVYPNPANDLLHVSAQSGLRVQTSVEMADAAGKVILKKEGISGSELQIDLSGVAKGIYFLTISAEGYKTQHQKLVKN